MPKDVVFPVVAIVIYSIASVTAFRGGGAKPAAKHPLDPSEAEADLPAPASPKSVAFPAVEIVT